MVSFTSCLASAASLYLCLTSVTALPGPHSRTSTRSLSVPLNGLPTPKNLTLKYVALGLGTQNYTCYNTSSAPISVGALAVLYDATSMLVSDSASTFALSALAYATGSSLSLPTLGHHFFSASAVPTFDLEAADPQAFLSAKKMATVDAPFLSMPDSVAWLYLTDDGRGVSRNLKAVYRVETAGGDPPTSCTEVGDIEMKYAAEYWFFI